MRILLPRHEIIALIRSQEKGSVMKTRVIKLFRFDDEEGTNAFLKTLPDDAKVQIDTGYTYICIYAEFGGQPL